MSRVQLALRVSDLEGSVAFYTKLFGVEPAKRRPGYANFAVDQPPLKLVLIEGEADQPTVMDHLGVEVFHGDEVQAATTRLTDAGLITLTENDTECCYALQDKVWVRGPGNEPWEVYVVKGDADQLGTGPGSDCSCGEAGERSGERVGASTGPGCC
jgi:catechol 2,3-dioxygenase-like lactoylglutathione lyase family enzyme